MLTGQPQNEIASNSGLSYWNQDDTDTMSRIQLSKRPLENEDRASEYYTPPTNDSCLRPDEERLLLLAPQRSSCCYRQSTSNSSMKRFRISSRDDIENDNHDGAFQNMEVKQRQQQEQELLALAPRIPDEIDSEDATCDRHLGVVPLLRLPMRVPPRSSKRVNSVLLHLLNSASALGMPDSQDEEEEFWDIQEQNQHDSSTSSSNCGNLHPSPFHFMPIVTSEDDLTENDHADTELQLQPPSFSHATAGSMPQFTSSSVESQAIVDTTLLHHPKSRRCTPNQEE